MTMYFLKSPENRHQFVHAEKSETLVLAVMICRQLGMVFPAPQMTKWLDAQIGEYDNRAHLYWLPYGSFSDGTIYVLPWARGAFKYFAAMAEVEPPCSVDQIDPGQWCHGLLDAVAALSPEDRTLACARVMNEHTDPELAGPALALWLDAIRNAQASGMLMTDPVRIRRRLASIKRVEKDKEDQQARDYARAGIQPD